MSDAQLTITLVELCEACNAEQTVLIEMVEFGVLDVEPPQVEQPSEWIFQAATVERAQKALRLHRDLSINLEGVALALDLLAEIDELRAQLHQLKA